MGVVESEAGMLKVECVGVARRRHRQNQSTSILREEALKANHARSRERGNGSVRGM